jgi:hypothetical protein
LEAPAGAADGLAAKPIGRQVMRLGYLSLFVFSLLMVAWVVFAEATGRSPDPILNSLLTGVLMTIVSLGLWQLDRRVTALEEESSGRR